MTSPQTIEKPRTKARLYKAEFIGLSGKTWLSESTYPSATECETNARKLVSEFKVSKFSRVVEFVEK